MKIYTVHTRPGHVPILVREGFSWGAFFFGWIWFLFQRAWIAAILNFVLALAVARLSRVVGFGAPGLGLLVLQGLLGRDVVRWSLTRRGYVQNSVVGGDSEGAALQRLFTLEPGLLTAS